MRSERRRAGRILPERPFRRSDCERLQRRPPARNQHWADAVTRPQRVLNFAVWISAAITAALALLTGLLAGLAERDATVFDWCHGQRLPVAVTMAGGYAENVNDIVSIHASTLKAAAMSCKVEN